MPFDLSSAKPVESGGFDLSTAKPVGASKKEAPPIIGGEREGSAAGDVFGLASKMSGIGGVTEPLASMATGFLAKPISEVMGMSAAAFGEPGGDPKKFQEDWQRRLTYEPRTEAGKSPTNPINMAGRALGSVVKYGGEALGGAAEKGAGKILPAPVASAIGSGVTEAAEQAPGFLGVKAPAAASAASAALKGAPGGGASTLTARGMMQSALKPSARELRTGEAGRGIDTLLNEGLNVTRGGMEKMQGPIDVLNNRISKMIDNSPATVNKAKVGSYLRDTFDKFRNQVNSTTDLAAIQRAWEQFRDNPLIPGMNIPVKTAQEMKQGTYRALGDKAYGELKGAEIESQKALARGLKEEIAKVVPEVRTMNAQESQLLNALSLVEKRVLMSANKNPVGLGWLTLNPEKFALWMVDRSELFKSIIARMLNQTSRGVGMAGPIGPPVGLAATEQAHQQSLPPQ